MATSIRHKRGDTAEWYLILPEEDFPDGYFDGWEIAAQIRQANEAIISSLEATWAEPAETTRTIRLFSADTRHWPVGFQEVDVQFTRTSDGYIRSSETFLVDVIKDVTIPSAA